MSADDHLYDVCIVGGGLGGLATAVALLLAGFDNIIICERDKQVFDRKQGYGLTLTNSLTGPLARLQLLDTCIEQNCLSQSHYTFTSSGEIIGYYGRLMKNLLAEKQLEAHPAIIPPNENDQGVYGGSRGNLRIPRQDLRDMMFQKIQQLLQTSSKHHNSNTYGDMVRWGYKFITFDECDEYVTTTFACGLDEKEVKITSRVVLGADGIRSKVRLQRDLKLRFTPSLPTPETLIGNKLGLHYLGINVILGISAIAHPLLYKKGFYVVDGTHRMFTMPYYTPSTTTSANNTQEEKPLIMWQLSYSNVSECEAMQLRGCSSDTLLSLALSKVQHWFPCNTALLEGTLPGEIWSTPLYDREAMKLQTREKCSRVTVLGDACHPMSMMKGQGANQALEDAILFVEYFDPQSTKNNPKKKKKNNSDKKRSFETFQHPQQTKEQTETETKTEKEKEVSNEVQKEVQNEVLSLAIYPTSTIYCKLRNFERDMVARSFPKVLASREAAMAYHSPEIVHHSFGINGLKDEQQVEEVLARCKAQGVTAYLDNADAHSNALDSQFEGIVRQLVFGEEETK